MSPKFDFDQALKALQEGQALTGKNGILSPLIKQLTEAALAAELDSHLAQDIESNRKNGTTKKTISRTYAGRPPCELIARGMIALRCFITKVPAHIHQGVILTRTMAERFFEVLVHL